MKATKRGAILLAPSLAVVAIALSGAVFAELTTVDPTYDDDIVIKNLARMDELLAKADEIMNAADSTNRARTKEEDEEIDEYMREHDQLERDNKRRRDLNRRNAAMVTPNARRTAPAEDDPNFRPANSAARDHGGRRGLERTGGFKSAGEFYRAVRLHAAGQIDPRLAASPTTVSTEGTGADGGFAVPTDFRTTILERVFDVNTSLFSRTDPIPIEGSSVTFPADMTTPWDSSGGIQAFWEGEGGVYQQSKVKLEGQQTKLAKLTALVPVSDELLEDATALAGYIERKAPERIDFKLSMAIVWGNGAGMPLGFMNAPALVTVAAEGGQTTDTINATNVLKMFSRMPVSRRPGAVWLIHPDAEPQLSLMTIGNQPVYIPPGGLSGSPYGLLLGRPVIPHEVCETVGDLGDIMFVDFASYLSIRKQQGLKSETSIHLWFDQGITAFRFTLRAGGQPWWSAPISPRDGSSTRSPFITLASR